MKKKTNIIIIAILLILFIIEVILVKLNLFKGIDSCIYNFVSMHINPINTVIFKSFSFLCSEIFIIGLCLLVLLFSKQKSGGVGFIFVLFLTYLFNQGLKLIIGRDRPQINQLVIEDSFSFPSGHTMMIVAIVSLFIFYIWKREKGKKEVNIIATVLLIIIAVFVMLSRIYLGVHYFSDILGGITASLLLLSLIYYFYNFKYKVPYFPKKKK